MAHKKVNGLLVCALGLFSALSLTQWSFVPLYDGAAFFEYCFQQFALKPFNASSLMCFNHPALVPTTLFGLSQVLFFGEVWPTLLISWLLGLSSILALWLSIKLLFPKAKWPIAEAGALLYAVNPSFVANTINPNLDFAVLIFSTWMFAALLSHRFGLCALCGVLMAMSKESGLLVYVVVIGLWTLLLLKQRSKQLLVLALPLVVFGGYVLWRQQLLGNERVFHTGGNFWNILRVFLDFRIFEPHMEVYSVTALGINFQWILTVSMLMVPIVFLSRLLFRKSVNGAKVSELRIGLFLGLLFLCLLYLLVRYRYWNNARYFLPLMPILILSAVGAWHFYFQNKWIKVTLMLVTGVLLGISNFKSVDPFARWYFGTFSFGAEEMLQMGCRGVNECSRGIGRDQLVYNLQFANLHYLVDQIFREIPKDASILVVPGAEFHFMKYRNAMNGGRTMYRPDVIRTKIVTVPELVRRGQFPPELYALDFPNIYSLNIEDRILKKEIPYEIVARNRAKKGKYELRYVKLALINRLSVP